MPKEIVAKSETEESGCFRAERERVILLSWHGRNADCTWLGEARWVDLEFRYE